MTYTGSGGGGGGSGSGGGSGGYFGQFGDSSHGSDFNRHSFLAEQQQARIRTGVPVKVVAVHGGGVGAPPTVDVQMVVKQMDGAGNTSSHGTIYGIPCTRVQGGTFAVICDPVVGDIGLMNCCDRDISSLKSNNGQESQPGSFRRHNVADAVFHGPMLNPNAPQHFIQVQRDSSGNVTGLNFTSPAGLNLNGVTIDKNGNLAAPGDVTAGSGTGDSVTLQHHTHPGTPAPTPGT